MKIIHIKPPEVYTDDGNKRTLREFEPNIRIGCTVEYDENTKKYKVIGDTTDTDCVGGVCPIR